MGPGRNASGPQAQAGDQRELEGREEGGFVFSEFEQRIQRPLWRDRPRTRAQSSVTEASGISHTEGRTGGSPLLEPGDRRGLERLQLFLRYYRQVVVPRQRTKPIMREMLMLATALDGLIGGNVLATPDHRFKSLKLLQGGAESGGRELELVPAEGMTLAASHQRGGAFCGAEDEERLSQDTLPALEPKAWARPRKVKRRAARERTMKGKPRQAVQGKEGGGVESRGSGDWLTSAPAARVVPAKDISSSQVVHRRPRQLKFLEEWISPDT